MSGNSTLDGRMTEHPMTEATPLASEQITQEDRELAEFIVSQTRGYGVKLPNDEDSRVQAAARHRIAALSASPAPSGQGVSGESRITKDWCLNMARLEEGHEIGAGMPDHPLRQPETAAPAPSCAPVEVERAAQHAVRCMDTMQPTIFVQVRRDELLTLVNAALSPQGLDAKEGGE